MRMRLIAVTTVVANIPGYNDHEDQPNSADDLAEQAGRLCYESWERPNPETATNEGYLRNILGQKHFSVLEHASATFYFDGVTRNLTHEFIRHRHLSYSEVSQRYVNVGDFPFIDHPGLEGIASETSELINESNASSKKAYHAIMEDLTANGATRKQARQAARHVLSSGTETKILVSGNMRAWREVIQKRLSPAADLEFQYVAKALVEALSAIAPNTFQDFK